MTLSSLFVGAAPSVLWLALLGLILWRSSTQRSTLHLFPRALFLGIVATLPALALELVLSRDTATGSQAVQSTIWQNVIIAALAEELLKFAALYFGFIRGGEAKSPRALLLFGLVVGLGFVTIENLLVTFTFGEGDLLSRTISTTILHAGTTGLFGLYAGFAFTVERKRSLLFQALIIAILFHAVFNFLVLTDTLATNILMGVSVGLILILLAIGWRKLPKGAPSSPAQ